MNFNTIARKMIEKGEIVTLAAYAENFLHLNNGIANDLINFGFADVIVYCAKYKKVRVFEEFDFDTLRNLIEAGQVEFVMSDFCGKNLDLKNATEFENLMKSVTSKDLLDEQKMQDMKVIPVDLAHACLRAGRGKLLAIYFDKVEGGMNMDFAKAFVKNGKSDVVLHAIAESEDLKAEVLQQFGILEIFKKYAK